MTNPQYAENIWFTIKTDSGINVQNGILWMRKKLGGMIMIILRCLKKILVLPLILVLAFVWMIVKTIVSLYEIAHGILFSLVVVFCILSIAVYGDWLQTGLLAILGFISFLILSVGIFGEVLLGELINGIWSFWWCRRFFPFLGKIYLKRNMGL